MRTLSAFKNFVEEINKENGRLYKQSVLHKYKDDPVIIRYLKIAFDPFAVYGISTKKLNKSVGDNDITGIDSIFELFNYLTRYNTGTDKIISLCQDFITNVEASDPDAARLLEKLICKDLVIGCDAKTINKEIPGCIPAFNVQLAQKYFEKPERVEGKTFAITTKIDGGRIIAIKDPAGLVSFYTRAGQKYEGLVDLEAAFSDSIWPNGIVLDGEITILDDAGIPSKEAYKKAMKITRSDGDKHGLKMKVFDILTYEEWINQKCEHTYDQRRLLLNNLGYCYRSSYFELLPELYRGTDTSKILELLDEAIANQEEGVMINICDAMYEFGRTWNLMKVKKMNTLDLEVVDYEEGSGRLAGTLGAIHVRYKNGNIVKVGSGFSDELRRQIWTHEVMVVGKIVEIQYFEETTNADGGESLRFPVFKDFRPDKLTADF